jgi:hypothetical protein
VVAWGVGAIYLLFGTTFIVALGIAGLWEGFAHRMFIFRFLGIVAYVFGTAGLAFWVGARPSRLGAIALAALMVPGIVSFVNGARASRDLADTARQAITAQDEPTRERARQELLVLGQRSGRQPHVAELVRLLDEVESDTARTRVVELLGRLSYQNRSVIEALHRLRDATRDDPSRGALHEAVLEALRQVDPYG